MNNEQLLNAIEALVDEIDDDDKLGRLVRRMFNSKAEKPKPDPFPGDADSPGIAVQPTSPPMQPSGYLYAAPMSSGCGTKYGIPGGGYRYGIPFGR